MAVTLNATTLAAALKPEDTLVTLTSGATVQKGHFLYCDREAMLVLAPYSTTSTNQFICRRGDSGTPAEEHKVGANVKTGPPEYFGMFNPAGAASGITSGLNPAALPWINIYTGDAFTVAAGVFQQVGVGGVTQGTAVWP